MIYQRYQPKHPLNQFISHFTYYKNYTPDHYIDRFLPDGNVEIVIDLTEEPKYIYDNELLTEKQACRKIWLSGIRTQFISIPSGRNSEMFVINFRKGMARSFLQLPLSEITDTVTDGDLILNTVYLILREKLLETKLPLQKFRLAESMLLKQFSPALAIHPVINYAVNHITAKPEVAIIKNIACQTGYSHKHLVALFEKYVGVSPKSFLRILRFQKAVREMENTGKADLTRLALDCGYYDQSHFISDFKTFSGYTPLVYSKMRGDYINYVPVK